MLDLSDGHLVMVVLHFTLDLSSVVVKDLSLEDKDLWSKDKDKDLKTEDKHKDLNLQDKYKDKDLNLKDKDLWSKDIDLKTEHKDL